MSIVTGPETPEQNVTLEPFDFSVKAHYLTKLFELAFLYDLEDDLLNFDARSLARLADAEKRGFSPRKKSERSLEELRTFAREFISHELKEKLLIDGRYHIAIGIKKFKVYLTNQLVNVLMEVLGSNINFDDGMDCFLRNQYETTNKVSLGNSRVCKST
jgi:hypothetical protein